MQKSVKWRGSYALIQCFINLKARLLRKPTLVRLIESQLSFQLIRMIYGAWFDDGTFYFHLKYNTEVGKIQTYRSANVSHFRVDLPNWIWNSIRASSHLGPFQRRLSIEASTKHREGTEDWPTEASTQHRWLKFFQDNNIIHKFLNKKVFIYLSVDVFSVSE